MSRFAYPVAIAHSGFNGTQHEMQSAMVSRLRQSKTLTKSRHLLCFRFKILIDFDRSI